MYIQSFLIFQITKLMELMELESMNKSDSLGN